MVAAFPWAWLSTVRMCMTKSSSALRSTVFRFAVPVRLLAARSISAAIRDSMRKLSVGKHADAATRRISNPVATSKSPNAFTAAVPDAGWSNASLRG